MGLGMLIVLALPLLTTTASAQQAAIPSGTEVRRIEVGSDGTKAHTVFIQPELATTLLFSAPLALDGVELERRESFKWLEIGEHSISLVPAANLKPETRLRLTVRFADATKPTSAQFQLEVSSSRGERQVEIDRLLPSCEGCAKQLREVQEETLRCKEALQAGRVASGGANLLTGLLVSGRMDAQGIRTRDVDLEGQAPTPVRVLKAISLRSVNSVAVRLEVQLPEGAPWTLEGAVLASDEEGEKPLKGWPSTPLPPGRSTLILEGEAAREELRHSYVLEVHEAGGTRTIVIGNVQFP